MIQDPREISFAAAVTRMIEAGHHGIIICGSGHLKTDGMPRECAAHL